jgi:hypothetical protein
MKQMRFSILCMVIQARNIMNFVSRYHLLEEHVYQNTRQYIPEDHIFSKTFILLTMTRIEIPQIVSQMNFTSFRPVTVIRHSFLKSHMMHFWTSFLIGFNNSQPQPTKSTTHTHGGKAVGSQKQQLSD